MEGSSICKDDKSYEIEMGGKRRIRTVEYLFKFDDTFDLLMPEGTREGKEENDDISAEEQPDADSAAPATERIVKKRAKDLQQKDLKKNSSSSSKTRVRSDYSPFNLPKPKDFKGYQAEDIKIGHFAVV